MARESSSGFLMHELPSIDSLHCHSDKYKGREKILKGVSQTFRHFRTKKKHLNPNACFAGLQLVEFWGSLWFVIKVLHLIHFISPCFFNSFLNSLAFPLKDKCVNNIRLTRCVQTQDIQSRTQTSIKKRLSLSSLEFEFFFFKVK